MIPMGRAILELEVQLALGTAGLDALEKVFTS